jgi:hypothetical protein
MVAIPANMLRGFSPRPTFSAAGTWRASDDGDGSLEFVADVSSIDGRPSHKAVHLRAMSTGFFFDNLDPQVASTDPWVRVGPATRAASGGR